MTVNKTKQPVVTKSNIPVKAGTLKLPTPLDVALQHFLTWNENSDTTKKNLFKLLHLAAESDTFTELDKFERSDLFFTVRELSTLVDALHLQKKLIFE